MQTVDQLGEKVSISGGVPLSSVIKDGKIDRDALQQGAIEGLDQLRNKQTKQTPTDPAAPAETKFPEAEPEANAKPEQSPTAASEAPAEEKKTKTNQKQQKKKEQRREVEEATKQILQNLLGD